MKKIIIFTIIITVLSASFIKDHQESNKSECSEILYKRPEQFMIQGIGEIYVEPSIVKINYAIQIEEVQAADALRKANEIQARSFKSLQSVDTSNAGISIKKTSFSLYPETKYDYNYGSNKIIFQGFKAYAQYELTTTNMKIVGDLVDTAIKSGVTNIISIDFDVKEEQKKEFEDQVLQLAIQDAKNKADVVLKSLNMKILSIKSISNQVYMNYNNYRPLADKQSFNMAEGMAAPTMEIHSQDKVIKKTVNIGFIIVPNDS